MKRKIAMLLALGMVLTTVACGSSGTGSSGSSAEAVEEAAAEESVAEETGAEKTDSAETDGEPVTLVLGHTNSETDSRQTEVLKFKELVEERTNGQVLIEIYPGGVLGNQQEETEGLKLRTQDILVEGYNIVSFYSDYCNDTLPYLYDNYDHFMACWYDSEVGDMWKGYAADAGFTVFAPAFRGFRVTTSNKKFTNADEIAGLKIRVPGGDVWSKTWEQLGAQPTPMDLSEVITGLQQGTVEAQENPVLLSYSYGFADVVDYLILTNHVCGADVFIMDSDRFSELSEEYQEIIVEAAEEAAKEISTYNYEEEANYIQMFADKGVEVIEPDLESIRSKFATFVEDNFPENTEVVEAIRKVEY